MQPETPITCARDLVQRDLVTVSPDTPLLDIHRLFVEEEIHGAPVVGDDGIVYGVVSTLDLLRAVNEEPEATRVEELTAADVMTKELVMVSPDTPIGELAQTMLAQHVHRVLVGSDGVLEGVITTFDVLRVVARTPGAVRHTGYTL